MKPFNLKEHLEHPDWKVVTRDGRSARIICTDAKFDYPVVALITICDKDDVYEVIESYTKDGCCCYGRQESNDLFFAPEKHEGWINVYRTMVYSEAYCGKIYDSYEEAKSHTNYATIATTKIEWEE